MDIDDTLQQHASAFDLLEQNPDLKGLTLAELQAISHALTALRQLVRQQGIDVQQAIGREVERQRVSKLLGREVQLMEPAGVDSGEALGSANEATG